MKKFYSWGIGSEPVIQYFPDLETALQDEKQWLNNYKMNGWDIVEPFGTREVTEEKPVYRIHLKVPIVNKSIADLEESDYVKYMYLWDFDMDLIDFSRSEHNYQIAEFAVEYLQTVFNKKEHLEHFEMLPNSELICFMQIENVFTGEFIQFALGNDICVNF